MTGPTFDIFKMHADTMPTEPRRWVLQEWDGDALKDTSYWFSAPGAWTCIRILQAVYGNRDKS